MATEDIANKLAIKIVYWRYIANKLSSEDRAYQATEDIK